MAGRVAGKVAFITGAARGQGRSHAVRLAQEGADIIAIDICRGFDDSTAPAATPEDLAETADMVKNLDRRIVTAEVDVRDYDALKAAVDSGVEQLGRLDIVVANAGIGTTGVKLHKMREDIWDETIDVNLGGVWKTVKAAVPHLLAGGSGSVIITSSVGGTKAYPQVGHYIAAKHGVVGLMRTFAVELGAKNIRVNTVHPTHVCTPLLMNESDLSSVPARPGEPGTRRPRADLPVVPLPADPVGGARRHQQCGPVPGLRRSPLHHRCHPARRRRQPSEIGDFT